MQADALKGLAVVAMAEGAKLGYVEDVVVDPQARRVAALLVGSNGQTFVVPFERVRSIGADAVTVESAQATQALSQGDVFSNLPGLSAMKKLKVVDEAGTFIGAVSGFALDQATGGLLSLTVHKGGILGLGGTTTTVDITAVRSIGPELVTIQAEGAAAPAADR